MQTTYDVEPDGIKKCLLFILVLRLQRHARLEPRKILLLRTTVATRASVAGIDCLFARTAGSERSTTHMDQPVVDLDNARNDEDSGLRQQAKLDC